MSTDNIGVSLIRTDGGTQARAGLDETTVTEYLDAMRDGAEFPPVVLFYDGTDYWLGDGFHRVEARRRLKDEGQTGIIAVDLRQGTRRDAVLFAAQANASHGLRRSADDKRRAVMCLLNDEEWGKWSDREIARRCHVSPTLVGKLRGEVVTVHVDSEPVERTYITKHGNTATMQTANIGNGGAVYESIHSLQSAVLAYHKRVCISNKDMIASLESLKADHKSSGWGALSLNLGRNGKIFRVNDLRQAVNNALDSMRFMESQTTISESSEPAQESPPKPDLTDLVLEYALTYQDPHGRATRDILNPAHTNGIFWRAALNHFESRGVINPAVLKIAIKKAFARLRNEPEPDTKYWEQFVKEDGDGSINLAQLANGEPIASAPVPNSEQPKPRISPYVMSHFQIANEAIARIATAIPKARTDDIHDMMAILASLERMERRIGAEYDMS